MKTKLATPARISHLTTTIRAAVDELSSALTELSSQADAQLAAAAEEFHHERSVRGPLWTSCKDSRKALLLAAQNANSLAEYAERATALLNSKQMPTRRLGDTPEILRVYDQRV